MKFASYIGQSCPYCGSLLAPDGKRSPTRDHVYPKSLGGHKTVVVCLECNNLKGQCSLWRWHALLLNSENPDDVRRSVQIGQFLDKHPRSTWMPESSAQKTRPL